MVSGDILVDVQEQGAIWTLPLYSSADEAKDPHFEAERNAWEKAREAARRGAAGILFYDPYGSAFAPRWSALRRPMALARRREGRLAPA